MKKLFLALASILVLFHLHAAQVMVFAAASLTDSLKQIVADYCPGQLHRHLDGI
jgi:hypothetical protein